MKFWDTSALMPLLLEERLSATMQTFIHDDPNVVVWTLTSVEVASALWRRHRAAPNDERRRRAAEQAAKLASAWTEIDDFEQVTRNARRLLSVHALRAGDALQLAAAIVAAAGTPATLPFVTLDQRLAAAARAEGFPVLP